MTTNPYFENTGFSTEQNLYEDLIIECLKIYGQDFQYIPRETLKVDNLFGEDTLSQFTNSYTVEMYVENVTGFEGQDLFQKFGVEIRDDATIVVAKRRWVQEVVTAGGEDLIRPREGDLIFVPFANALFEITFVEHEQPFYQLNNLPVYKLGVSLFEFNDQNIDLAGIGIDANSFVGSMTITVDDSTGFEVGEDIEQSVGSATVTGKIKAINGNILSLGNVSNDTDSFLVFTTGTVTGLASMTEATVAAIRFIDEPFGDNTSIENAAADITDFDPSDPFGGF